MKIELTGIISERYLHYDEIMIGDTILSEFMEDFDDKIVKLTYYVSTTELPKESITEHFLKQFYEGVSSVDNNYICGTSWTGCYARNDEVKIGGHDIAIELYDHVGKYAIIQIETA